MARRKTVSITFVDGTCKEYILLYTLEHVYVAQSVDTNKVQLLSKTVVIKVKGDPAVEVKRNNR
jgi:hypothetical protein